MAWTGSAMFTAFVQNNLLKDPGGSTPTGYVNLEADTIKAALYDNDITPDKNAAVALTGYNTGQWVASGNEVTDTDGTSNWSAGGIQLDDSAAGITAGSGFVMYDAADTSHAVSTTVTLANAFGCLVYDDTITAGTVAKQGICFNYFGGGQSVTAGTFTIVWHTSGVFRITT